MRVRALTMLLLVLLALSAAPASTTLLAGALHRPDPPSAPVKPFTSRNTFRALVLGHPGSERLMNRVARPADSAVEAVTGVWGAGWAQRVVVVVPENEAELRTLLAEDGDLDHIAALTDPVGRVVVNPDVFDTLSPTARRIVLTHEFTHVAARPVTTVATPYWLAEGLAEYVAYRGSPTSDRSIAHELADEIWHGGGPDGLPQRRDFRGDRMAQAYQEAWLACRLIVERSGEAALLGLYRRLSAGADLDASLRAETGLDGAGFLARWRDYLKENLG